MMKKWYREREGQASIAAIWMVLLLIAVIGTLVDVYNLKATRRRVYEAASAAALVGCSKRWELDEATGEIWLPSGQSNHDAQLALDQEMRAIGLPNYTADIRVLEHGGTMTDYPPVAHAHQGGRGNTWSSPVAAVGVYVTVPVTTTFLGFFEGGSTHVTLHVFAAAAVQQR